MTAITVTNTDWAIVEDLHDAVTAAAIGNAVVFKEVGYATSEDQAREAQLTGDTPRVILLYEGTTEDSTLEDGLNCVLYCSFFIATKSTDSQSAKLQEILRLVNAVKNAVETTPPSDSHTVGDGNFYHIALKWEQPSIDITETDPWIAATLPLEVGFSLSSTTSH